MRRRIVLATCGTVVAALVLAGLGTLVLARVDANDNTRQELEQQSTALASIFETFGEPLIGSGDSNVRLALVRQRLQQLARGLDVDDIGFLVAGLARIGRRNVEIRAGGGTKGWPEKAPFDAIVVSAGGPSAPPALKEQLRIGGRLIVPVGRQERVQRLVRITRLAGNSYEEEDLGGVFFVSLIGEGGWRGHPADVPQARRTVPDLIADAAEDLPAPEDPAFADAVIAAFMEIWS